MRMRNNAVTWCLVLSLAAWMLPFLKVTAYDFKYFGLTEKPTSIYNDNKDRGIAPCPSNCACSYENKKNIYIYNCSRTLVEIDYRLETVTIDCDGSLLDCTNLPKGLAAGQITYVAIKRCAVNSSLKCVLPALSSTGNFSLLSLEDLQTPVFMEMFFGLETVKTVLIYDYGLGKFGNQTPALSVEAFHYTPLLKTLGIFRCRNEQRLDKEIISPLTHLKELYVGKSKKLILGPKALSNFTSLWRVSLTESNITELPEDVFLGSSAIESLNLSNNELRYLPDTVFSGLRKLIYLLLTNNKLENISRELFAPLRDVEHIYLDRNRIKTLPDSLFSSNNLQFVSFASNLIENVKTSTFKGLKKLSTLDLSHNLLTWNCLNKTLKTSHKSGLVNNLRVLDLSHNQIRSVCAYWTYHVSEILDLSYNQLESLREDDLTFQGYDVRVNFENNNIATVSPPTVSPFSRVIFKLGFNPFNCDCHLYRLFKVQQDILDYIGSGGFILKNHYDLTNAQCSKPESLKYVKLLEITDEVKLDSVSCSVDGSDNCECLFRPNKHRIECRCEDMQNLTIPQSPFDNTTALKLKLLKSQDLIGLPSFVTELDMSGLQLESVPNIPSTLRELDLRNNSLQVIPPEVYNKTLMLLLENNPLLCDCSGIDNVISLERNQHKILNYSELLCADGFIVKGKDPNTLCNVYYSTVIGVSCIIGVVALVITIVLMYIYLPEVQVMFFHLGLKFMVREEWIDRGKIYDIFLSYSIKDEHFVRDLLLPKLEGMKYKVCEHTRDWVIGLPIPEQIYTSVANSKKTIFVVSEHFMKSVWVLEEFNATILQGAKDRKNRAVVILLEDVNLDNAPLTIKGHLALNTCIKWNAKDKSFWIKLQNALPKKLTAEEIKKRQKAVKAVKSLGTGFSLALNEDGKLVNTVLQRSNPTATPVIFYLESLRPGT